MHVKTDPKCDLLFSQILKDDPIPDDRIEIDVTPIQRRKRAAKTTTSSKTKSKKRRSSDLPLSEVRNTCKLLKHYTTQQNHQEIF